MLASFDHVEQNVFTVIVVENVIVIVSPCSIVPAVAARLVREHDARDGRLRVDGDREGLRDGGAGRVGEREAKA